LILVSVIIPTRNRSHYLKQAIDSILSISAQEFDIEIIVADDGSTDETAHILKSYPVQYIQTFGQGASKARNKGIEIAHGDLITFLDDDDVWSSNNLIEQVRILNGNPDFGAVCSQMMLADHNLALCAGPFPVEPLPSGWIFNELFGHIPVSATLLIRKSVLQAIGLFDTTLYGAEDWDLALRIARNYQIAFLEEVAVICRQHRQLRYDSTSLNQSRNEDIAQRRYLDVIKVAQRHLRNLSFAQKIKLQRKVLKWKGYFATQFLEQAQIYLQSDERSKAVRCLKLAVIASPLHTVSFIVRNMKNKYHISHTIS